MASTNRQAMAFYRFTKVSDPKEAKRELEKIGSKLDIRGTVLVAPEGVNGTLVGHPASLDVMRQSLVEKFGDMPFKFSQIQTHNQGFYRFKVKLKKEIVTFGVPDLDIQNNGTHVGPAAWNALLQDPDVVVVDTRNQYEIDIGTFPGAISPQTENFRDFPEWAQENLQNSERKKKVAMFCTGGIRCEKASAYLLNEGIEEVYQLDGGILKYLETVDEQDNLWQGECFVFDQRVSVDASLQQGKYAQCYACRHPITTHEMQSAAYEKGVSCPYCVDELGEVEKTKFRERQKQVNLAQSRGRQHIGVAQK